MSSKSIIKNYIYNVSYQILNILAPLITAPYVARVLGAENVGVYSYTTSITTYFITFAILGTEGFARREIAYRKSSKKSYSKFFWEMVIFRSVTSVLALILFVPVIIQSDYKSIFAIQAISIVSVIVDISWLFQGLEIFSTIALRNYIIKIISIIGIFSFVHSGKDLPIYVFLLVGLTFVSNSYLCFAARKYVCKIPLSELEINGHIKGVLKLFIPTIAVSIYSALDKTMIGIISPSMNQNGYYEQAEKIIKMLITIVNSLGFVVAPRIAEAFSKGDRFAVKEYMKKSYHFIWLLAIPMMVGIYSTSDMIVPWFYGMDYSGVIPIMKVMSLIIPVISFSMLTGVQYLISTQQESFYTISLFIGALINFACNIILIPRYYALGAAIATVIGEGSITLSQIIFVIKKERLMTFKDMFSSFFKCLFFSLIMLLVVSIIKHFFTIYTVFNTTLVVIIGGIVYFSLLYVSKDQMFMNVLAQLKRRFYKND